MKYICLGYIEPGKFFRRSSAQEHKGASLHGVDVRRNLSGGSIQSCGPPAQIVQHQETRSPDIIGSCRTSLFSSTKRILI
jgi:hypothetical protein